jgi:DNA topoisomerase-1
LFQYVDPGDGRQSIDSSDVNAYLKEITGQEFTAKDFRTWSGTILAALQLRELPRLRRNDAREAPSRRRDRLGGEAPRQHPDGVPQLLRPSGDRGRLEGRDRRAGPARPRTARLERKRGAASLSAEESAVMSLLRRRLESAGARPKRAPRVSHAPRARAATGG